MWHVVKCLFKFNEDNVQWFLLLKHKMGNLHCIYCATATIEACLINHEFDSIADYLTDNPLKDFHSVRKEVDRSIVCTLITAAFHLPN